MRNLLCVNNVLCKNIRKSTVGSGLTFIQSHILSPNGHERNSSPVLFAPPMAGAQRDTILEVLIADNPVLSPMKGMERWEQNVTFKRRYSTIAQNRLVF